MKIYTRPLTDEFKKIRSQRIKRRYPKAHNGYGQLEDDVELGQREPTGSLVETAVKPEWSSYVDDVKETMAQVSDRMQQLRDNHKRQLKPTFGDDADHEQEIEILTKEIKELFMRCERDINNIGSFATSEDSSEQERKMCKNIQMSLATQVMQLSQEFKKDQRMYLQRLKAQRDRVDEIRPIDWDDEEERRRKEIEDKIYDPGFTEAQINEVLLNEALINERDQQVRNILKSITELSDMFKDLSLLVIEQGTLIDQIDNNMEQTNVAMRKAVEELKQTEKYQRKNLLGSITMCLVISIILVSFLLVVKLVVYL